MIRPTVRLAGLVLAASGVALASTVLTAVPVSASGCGPAPDGLVAVAVLVDAGISAPIVRCVTVPPGTKGAAVLAAAIGQQEVRTGAGIQDKGAGFVCGLLGVPATGCTSAVDEPTWNYWHADPGGDWRYSSTGFAGYAVGGRCAIEGWTYDRPAARPRVAPPPVSCDVAALPTTAPAPAAAAPAPPTSAAAARPGPAPLAGPAAGAVNPTVTDGSTAPSGGLPAAAPVTSTAPPDAPDAAGATAASGRTASGDGGDETVAPDELASVRQVDERSGPGAGLVLAVGAVAALAVVAVVRARTARRGAELGV